MVRSRFTMKGRPTIQNGSGEFLIAMIPLEVSCMQGWAKLRQVSHETAWTSRSLALMSSMSSVDR